MRQHFIKAVIFGDPGVGKTPLIGSSEKALILDADNGTESAVLAGSNAEVWTVSSHQDLLEVHEYLREEKHDYRWVWLDSVTLFQELGLDDIMAELIMQKPHRDRFVPDQHQYLQNMNRLSHWTRHMKALPLNFGMTAHVMQVETPEGDDMFVPQITGKGMWSRICGYMNLVGHLRIAENEKRGRHWVLTCEKNKSFYGKDRFGAIGVMREPTIPKIEALIQPLISNKSPKKKKKAKKGVK